MEKWITYRSCLLAYILQKYLHKNMKSKTSQTYKWQCMQADIIPNKYPLQNWPFIIIS